MLTRPGEMAPADPAYDHLDSQLTGSRRVLSATSALREAAQLAPLAAVLAVMLNVATRFETGHRELAAAAVTVLLTQVLPGTLLWRLVRPSEGWLIEDLAVGFAVGAAVAVPTQLLSVAIHAPWLDLAVPALLVVALLGVKRTGRRIRTRRLLPLPWLWGCAVAAGTFIPLLGVRDVFGEPVRWAQWARPYVDVPFHEALSAEFLHRFPPHYPQVAAETLSYHWFTYAWTAQISSVSGTDVAILLWRFEPSLIAVSVPLLTAVVALRLSGKAWVGAGAAVIGFTVQAITPWAVQAASTPLHTPLSPTQGFGLLVFLPAFSLLALRWRGLVHPSTWLLLGLLLTVAGGAKGSMLPVVVAGCLLASAYVLALRRSLIRIVWADTALAIAIMALLSMTMFGGGAGGVELSGPDTFFHVRATRLVGDGVEPYSVAGIVASVLALLAIALPGIAAVGVLADRATRREPVTWLLLGSTLSGFGAVVFLAHPGHSQWYFFFTAQTPMAILAAWGLGLLLSRLSRPAPVLWSGAMIGLASFLGVHLAIRPGHGDVPGLDRALIALAGFAGLVVGACWTAARLLRGPESRRLRLAALLVVAVTGAGLVPAGQDLLDRTHVSEKVSATPSPGGVHASEIRAFAWVRDNSEVDDVVMTNRHCSSVSRSQSCDHRRFALAAGSERRVLVEGWAYTKGARRQYQSGAGAYSRVPFWDDDLLALNDGFIERPTAEAADRLRELGVRWVVVDLRPPHAGTLAPYAVPRLRTRFVTVYELPRR